MARKGGARGDSGRTILLVDDSREVLESSGSLLEREGHRVLRAESARQGIDILHREEVDLLLVDYFMPGMTGEEMINEVRTFNKRVQIVLQTGYASEKPPREMLARLDIQGYCDKSSGPEEFLLWADVGLKFAKQVRTLEMGRQGLRYILDVTPDLHRIQPLEDLLRGILFQIAGLVGSVHSFVAVRPDKAGSPDATREPDALLAMVEEERDLVIHAGIGRYEGHSTLEDALNGPGLETLNSALHDGAINVGATSTAVPLRIGASTIGVIHLDKASDLMPENIEMLHVFANQAAVAVQNALLYQMATLDPLTGVYARKFWEQMALREIRTAFRFRHPLVLVVLDLDKFKSINDEQGHLTGDKALETIGRILRESSRSSDVVGRYGGDEFVAVLPRTDKAGASVFCNRVLRELERQDVTGPSGPCKLRSSMGLSVFAPHDFNMTTVSRPIANAFFQNALQWAFSRADRQVYISKRAGGHQFHFSDQTDWPDPGSPQAMVESGPHILPLSGEETK